VIRLVETATGAQILPPAVNERATITAWLGHLICDADQRRYPEYAEIASRLTIERTPE